MLVQGRLEGRGQDTGKGGGEQPPKKVAETYEEAARSQPAEDSITILGIPLEQITAATHAALSGLVAENNYLRGALARHDRKAGAKAKEPQPDRKRLLEYNTFISTLGTSLAASPGNGLSWIIILVHLRTYEALLRNSGLLAANGSLEDVGDRFAQINIGGASLNGHVPSDTAETSLPFDGTSSSLAEQDSIPSHLALAGFAGGSSVAGLVALPAGTIDTTAIARQVRDHICEAGFHVGGVDMALEVQVAAAICGVGESPLLALGRVDQLMRAS